MIESGVIKLGDKQVVRIGEVKKRVNCLFIEEEALWAIYIEYKRITPNPRLGDMTILPLTPPMHFCIL